MERHVCKGCHSVDTVEAVGVCVGVGVGVCVKVVMFSHRGVRRKPALEFAKIFPPFGQNINV